MRRCLLQLENLACVGCLDDVGELLLQDFERAFSRAMAGVDLVDAEFADGLRKGTHLVILAQEQVQSADERADGLAGKRSTRLVDDGLDASVGAAVEDDESRGRLDDEALLVVESVADEPVIGLQVEVLALTDLVEPLCAVAQEPCAGRELQGIVDALDT